MLRSYLRLALRPIHDAEDRRAGERPCDTARHRGDARHAADRPNDAVFAEMQDLLAHGDRTGWADEFLVRDPAIGNVPATAAGLDGLWVHRYDYDPAEDLRQMDMPVLAFCGAEDRIVPARHRRGDCRRHPDADYRVGREDREAAPDHCLAAVGPRRGSLLGPLLASTMPPNFSALRIGRVWPSPFGRLHALRASATRQAWVACRPNRSWSAQFSESTGPGTAARRTVRAAPLAARTAGNWMRRNRSPLSTTRRVRRRRGRQ